MNSITHSVEDRLNLFLQKSKKHHGDKYDYTKVVYTRAQEKVEIICPKHGSFFQSAYDHSQGRGCRKCSFENKPKEFSVRKTQEDFIKECMEKHKGKYGYSKVEYETRKSKIKIDCSIHGEFEQDAGNHLLGAGCPKCGIKKAHDHFRKDNNHFIEKSRKVHGDRYDYSESTYVGKAKPIDIMCKDHGKFTLQKASYHYTASNMGCPECSAKVGVSQGEIEISMFLEEIGVEHETSNRTLLEGNQEVDLYMPNEKVAIEYNGLYWHSEQMGKNSKYHLDKTQKLAEKGIRLIHIFEDEWVKNKDLVKRKLSHILNKSTLKRVFARKLQVKRIGTKEAKVFLENNHIQGFCMFSQGFGLYEGEELVSLMTFGKNRFTKDGGLELIRYATSKNVVGGFSKLLTSFKRENPEVTSLISYSDKRWSVGNVYEKNGFIKVGESQPSYFYFKGSILERYHRTIFQKHKLSALLQHFDPSKTESENLS